VLLSVRMDWHSAIGAMQVPSRIAMYVAKNIAFMRKHQLWDST
jgi:hypothetical protein